MDGLDGWVDGWMNEWMDEWINEWIASVYCSSSSFFSCLNLNEWMNGWMDEKMNEWMNEWMNGWMDKWVNGWTGEWIDEWMDIVGILLFKLPLLFFRPSSVNGWMDEWMKRDRERDIVKRGEKYEDKRNTDTKKESYTKKIPETETNN